MATDRLNEAETYLGQKAWLSASSGRANDERMARAIERLDERVRPPAPAADNAIFMQKAAVGAEYKSASPNKLRTCASQKWWRRRESNPKVLDRSILQNLHRTAQNLNITKHLGNP